MPSTVVCPNCRARFEIASDLAADAPIRCKKCVHTFLRGDADSAGIQAGPAPLTVTPSSDDDRRDEAPRPPRRPTARPPISMVSFLWIALGVVLLLLVISLGFNVWVMIGHPDRRNRFEDEMRAERAAMAAREMAEQARQNAAQMELEAKIKVEELRKQQEELARQLKRTEDQMEEARLESDRAKKMDRYDHDLLGRLMDEMQIEL